MGVQGRMPQLVDQTERADSGFLGPEEIVCTERKISALRSYAMSKLGNPWSLAFLHMLVSAEIHPEIPV